MIVDTHLHIWQRARSGYVWLNRAPAMLQNNYSLDQLETERMHAGIHMGVLVQADNTIEDTYLMLEAANRLDWIKGVVGWLPLMDPDKTAQLLDSFVAKKKWFKAVRHLIHNEPDENWLLQPQVLESLQLIAARKLPFDLVGVSVEHIKTALKVAEKVPDLRLVFDHLNQPPIKKHEYFGQWGIWMKEAAKYPGFYSKISGLGAPAGKLFFCKKHLKPYIEFIINEFGSQRCFCGSDWPLSLITKNYQGTWEVYKQVLHEILGNSTELRSVLGNNAIEFYKL